MRKTLQYLALSLMVMAVAVSIGLAQGKDRSATFTLGENDKAYYLNGTMIERGSYRIKYDGDTGMMTIKHDGKDIATVKPRIVEEAEKSEHDAVTTKQGEKGLILVSVRFEGDRRTFYVDQENLTVSEKTDEDE